MDMGPGEDLSLEDMLQLVATNDEQVLTSTTLWSDRALEAAGQLCAASLDMAAVMLTLRDEARRRGLAP